MENRLRLLRSGDLKVDQLFPIKSSFKRNRIATDLAIFHEGLTGSGGIQQDRNRLPAVGTRKKLLERFHLGILADLRIFAPALGMLAGCGQPISTPFVSLPLGTHRNFCALDSNGISPKPGVAQIDEKGEVSGKATAKGGGCIARPLREVWAVIRHPATITWRESELKETEVVNREGAIFALRSRYEAGFIRQSWVMEWVHHLEAGTIGTPQRISVRYQKVEGTGHIPHWRGELEMVEVGPSLTSVGMHNEIRAALTGVDRSVQTVQDFIGRLSLGTPLPGESWKSIHKGTF